jgi:alpha-glucosidase
VAPPPPWWQDAVLYQIYPRSFADSNGDGIGDLEGIRSRLDHLEWLGVDGVWLNPTFPSPNADWGYDVSDYEDVHPDLGTLAGLDRLVAECGARGIRVLLDLVPNHTSDRHRWFEEARASRDSPRRAWYVWADPRGGGPPDDRKAAFGGSVWTLDEGSGQYYLHHFLPEQPDLNWRNSEVGDAFDGILRYWFARSVAGFRIDVAHEIVKDVRGRVDLPATHGVLRRWRSLVEAESPPRLLLGETHVPTVERMASYYGNGRDELHLAFNFPFVYSRFSASALRRVVEVTEALIPAGGWPVWMLSNHDLVRFPSRWCYDDDTRARAALVALLTLRGTPVLYYGDELALPQTPIPTRAVKDVVDRDGCRTPMQWSDDPGAGFTTAGADAWLPFGDLRRNVRAQRGDPGSVLHLVRDLLGLRREREELRRGAYASLEAPRSVWAWRRGERTVVALNLSARRARLRGVSGSVLVSTERVRDGESFAGELGLRPWEGVVADCG